MKQTLKIGITLLVVTGLAMSGIALAQGDDDQAPATEAGWAVSVILERLTPLVEEGRITSGQAEAVAETLADGLPLRGRFHGPARRGVDAVAEFLDMEPADLVERLRGGATPAEIAGEQADDLVAFMVAAAADRLEAAVEAGRITREQADAHLAEIEERITRFVEEGPPPRAERPMRRGVGERQRGFGPGPGWGGGLCP
jgi:hypothetical protein